MSNPPLYETGLFSELALPKEDYIWTERDSSGLGAFGISVLKALLRYRILNRLNLEKALCITDRNTWKKDALSKVLRGLRKSDHIAAYLMNQSTLTVYILTTEGEQYLKNKGLTLPEMQTGKEIIKDTTTALKCLSINQWHIGVQSSVRVKESFYNQFVIDGRKVASLIRYHHGKDIVSLFAYAAPRQGDSINSFAEELLRAHHFVLEHPKYWPASYIIICESRNSATLIAHQMSYIRQMRPICDLIYTYDEITQENNFLKTMYVFDVTEDDLTKNAVDLS